MTRASDVDPHELARQVSGERLMGHIAEFARWTKHAGTEEERRSLAYVERELAEYGYRTELIEHEAYISLPVAGGVRWGDATLNGIAHSFSRSTGPDGVTAPLIAVGAGTAADFEGKDVHGRAVLIQGIANPAAALRASRAGAVAQIHVSPHEHLHEMCISPVWGSPDDRRRDSLPSTAVVTVSLEHGRRLGQALEDGTPVDVTVATEVDTGWRTTPILIAELTSERGGDEDPFVFFTGHHDTWYYGVMDNGGANATMIEVARICALHRAWWRRGLRIAVWSGHSQGRYSSSAWYADHHWEELERRALVHVNVDSTGGRGNTVVSDTTASAELVPLARDVLVAEADQPLSGRRMQRAGDQSFWGIGVPSIFGNMGEQPASGEANPSAAVFGTAARVGHGTGWWWHTPDDLADKIEETVLVRDTRVYAHAVWRLLTDELLPLDFELAAAEILEELRHVQQVVGDRLDLGPALRQAEDFAGRAADLNSRIRALSADGAAGERVNEVLRELSRIVVPLGYSGGDRFGHDPALAMGPIPALDGAVAVADLEAGSDEYLFLRSRLVREVNRVADGLRRACAVLERGARDLR